MLILLYVNFVTMSKKRYRDGHCSHDESMPRLEVSIFCLMIEERGYYVLCLQIFG